MQTLADGVEAQLADLSRQIEAIFDDDETSPDKTFRTEPIEVDDFFDKFLSKDDGYMTSTSNEKK